MSRRLRFAGLCAVLISALIAATSAFAAPEIRVVVDGKYVSMPVMPQIVNDRVLVPVRAIAEALSATVSWNPEQRVVTIQSPGTGAMKAQLGLLERTLEATTPEQTARVYAEAVKTRNGAVQYAMLSPQLRAARRASYEGMNWVTGTSSPWVESYQVSAPTTLSSGSIKFEVSYNYLTSAGPAGTTTQVLYVNAYHRSSGPEGSAFVLGAAENPADTRYFISESEGY